MPSADDAVRHVPLPRWDKHSIRMNLHEYVEVSASGGRAGGARGARRSNFREPCVEESTWCSMHHNGSRFAQSPNFVLRMRWRVRQGGRQGGTGQGQQKLHQIRLLRAGQVGNQIDCSLTYAHEVVAVRQLVLSVEV
ncbi:MAG: hypothetical protein JWO52_3075 [Gammaproteobacteria bacterium]|nr:hypothetical protein [Gammaproteobacteria bacterium]